jgi:hypothetical protein
VCVCVCKESFFFLSIPPKLRGYLFIINQLSGTALRYGLDDQGLESRLGLGFFFTTAFRPPLGPAQPPIQWVPGDLSLGVKRPGHKADHSHPSSAEVKNAWSYNSTPSIRLQGVALS